MNFREKYDQAIKLLHDWNTAKLGDYDYLPKYGEPKVPRLVLEVFYELTKEFFNFLSETDKTLFRKEFFECWEIKDFEDAFLSNNEEKNYQRCWLFRYCLFVFLIGLSLESRDNNLLYTLASKHKKLSFWDGYSIRDDTMLILEVKPLKRPREELFMREIIRLYRQKLFSVGSIEDLKRFIPNEFTRFLVELSMFQCPGDTFVLPITISLTRNGQQITIGQTADEKKFQRAVYQLLKLRFPEEMAQCATGKDADFLEASVLLSQELFPPSRNEISKTDNREIRKQREQEYLYYIEKLSS